MNPHNDTSTAPATAPAQAPTIPSELLHADSINMLALKSDAEYDLAIAALQERRKQNAVKLETRAEILSLLERRQLSLAEVGLAEYVEDEPQRAPAAKRAAKKAPAAKRGRKPAAGKAAAKRSASKSSGPELSDADAEMQANLKKQQKGKVLVLKSDSSVEYKTGRVPKEGCFPGFSTMDRRLWKIKK